MEQGLTDIFEKYGVYGANITEAQFYKKENRLLIRAECGGLVSVRTIELIRRELEALMPSCRVELRLSCSKALARLESGDEEAIELLKEAWCVSAPSVRPAIACSKWSCKNGVATVRVPSLRMGLLNAMGAAKAAEEYFKELYGTEIRIVFQPDDTLSFEAEAAKNTIEPAAPASEATKAEKPAAQKNSKPPKPTDKTTVILGRAIKKNSIMRQGDVTEDMGAVTIAGSVISAEVTKRKNGGSIYTIVISDRTNTLPCKIFLDEAQEKTVIPAVEAVIKDKALLAVSGRYGMDQWLRRMCVYPKDIGSMPAPQRMDDAEEKRVELHLHTKMSAMDGLLDVKDAINTAARWGHRAVAITDHGVVHAFPDAVALASKLKKAGKEIKVLLGVEGYLQPDSALIPRQDEYVAIAITSAPGVKCDEVFEIAAVRFGERGVIDSLSIAVDGGAAMPEKLIDQTGLTAEELAGGLNVQDALDRLYEFTGDDVKIVHDAETLNILREHALRLGLEFDAHAVLTGTIFHYLHRESKQTDLLSAAECLNIMLTGARAIDRANVTAQVTIALLGEMAQKSITKLPLFDTLPKEKGTRKRDSYHIIIMAKNHEGLMNLYRLVSYAHLEHLKKVPRIPRSLLAMHREGLIVGSACEAGELFRAVLAGESDERLREMADMYDFLEVQPIANNDFLVRNGTVPDNEGLRALNRRIVELGEEMNKPVAATGDVHFLEPEDSIFRSIIMHARGFEDAEEQAPLYFKTTAEMLEEFSYLGAEKAHEIVIDVPNAIADSCDSLKAFLSEKGTYAPTFPGANDELTSMAMKRAHEIYGDELPQEVQARLDKELASIIGNGYASLYLMAQRLVRHSMDDGYLVGSRGSVGSSLVANMAGITEVNALPPHYVCPNCRHSEFDVDRTKYACGVDMPDKLCPVCGTKYKKLGYEIPFEVFLGFKGDKTPDIDLNFSGEYQPKAHKYTEVMFGEGHAFRAGTISGVQTKTVYGYVKAYCEANGIHISRDETDRLVEGCLGVKKTTGQHPGGIVIVPEENDIMEFTPIQYPADRSEGNIITTHFDFHAMDDRLVKLDILGHDDPTALRMLKDITGLDPQDIPLDDPDTMKIFSSSEPLGVTLEELDCDVGSIAIPEFGTTFVRQMLKDTRPTTMEELVRIAGLSHGTDVWLGNAQDLVLGGTATLSEVICTRDDIMNYLISIGGEPSLSFKTMESVRKGRGLTDEMEAHMRSINTPQWFIDSCHKIKYMFPRAHAAAYVMMAFRIAYYKVHMPLAFYTVYYTVRADAFDVAMAEGGAEQVLKNINAIKKKGNDMDNKEADLLTILEVVYEMNKRGLELLPVDIYKSRASEFIIENGSIRPPFSAVAGVGAAAAVGIAEAAKNGAFTSLEDFQRRSGANVAVVKTLAEAGCLDGLPETDQLSLF